jgi:hypothetical protein
MPAKPIKKRKRKAPQKSRGSKGWFKEHWVRFTIIPIIVAIWTLPILQPIEDVAEEAFRTTGDVVETAANTTVTIFELLVENAAALSTAALTAGLAANEWKKFKAKK